MERRTFSVGDRYPEKRTVLIMTAVDNNEHTGGKEVGTYLAGGCAGCENIARQIAPEHLEKACKMGLE